VKVVVAEDSVLLREGITRVLENAGLDVVGRCGTAEELLSEVALSPPDVAVIDIRMPPSYTDEGFRAAKEIRARHPETGVLVLSQYIELGLALELVADSAEGAGYLLKDRVSDMDEFAAAVRRVGEGGSAIDPSIVSQLLGRARAHGPLDGLTPKEREVLELMAEGRSNQAIADRQAITLRSAEKHVSSIFAKLGVATTGDDHRRVLAVLLYLRA
jgi:DNA-binding NarL/FixJ family response regulator